METIGEEIKAVRLKQNISLDEIADRTNISKGHLLNIEENRLDLLPGGDLRWLIVREYLKTLGMDPEDSRFKRSVTPFTGSKSTAPAKKIRDHRPLFRFLFLTAATVSLLVLGGILLWREITSKRAEMLRAQTAMQTPPEIPILTLPPTTTIPNPATETATPPEVTDTVTAGTTPPLPVGSTTIPVTKEPLTAFHPDDADMQYAMNLWIEFQAPCWVSVNVDGKQVTRQEFYRGEKLPFRANNQISLILGNAGGVSIKINGVALRRVGAIGEVKRLIFTPDNYKEYLVTPETP